MATPGAAPAPLSSLGATAVTLLPAPVPASSLPPLSAPSALGGGLLSGVVGVAPRVAMEGKSLFTCHSCGSLLKFRYSPVSIEDRVRRLRPIEFEDADDGAASSDGDAGRGSGGRRSGVDAPNAQPRVLAEMVWESETSQESSDGAATWGPAQFAPALGVSAFYSSNRGLHGNTIADVVPARLLSKPHIWLSPEWTIDMSLPHCDEEGWIYAASFADFHTQSQPSEQDQHTDENGGAPQECVVRRRRLIRKRQIDGSDLGWFQELLDCSSLLLHKRTPSCHDCETAMLNGLLNSVATLEDERVQYEAFLEQFASDLRSIHDEDDSRTPKIIAEEEENRTECSDDWGENDPELRALEEEERQLLRELETIEDETKMVEAKRKELWESGMDLEQLIRGTFGEGAFLQHLLGLSRDERQSVGVFSVHASDMLRRLQRYNVCNDVFHIWHDGLFGTINGLRLGRLPSKAVEWVEINAALGQAVLLLVTIAERANFQFSRNRLVPRGSYSRVLSPHGKEYSLYSDGGMFRRRGFNQAMVLFLECVDEAGRRAMHEEPSLKFPYKIARGKIGDLPISLGNDEQWTKALKYMLTHLKWLLAWISKQYP